MRQLQGSRFCPLCKSLVRTTGKKVTVDKKTKELFACRCAEYTQVGTTLIKWRSIGRR